MTASNGAGTGAGSPLSHPPTPGDLRFLWEDLEQAHEGWGKAKSSLWEAVSNDLPDRLIHAAARQEREAWGALMVAQAAWAGGVRTYCPDRHEEEGP